MRFTMALLALVASASTGSAHAAFLPQAPFARQLANKNGEIMIGPTNTNTNTNTKLTPLFMMTPEEERAAVLSDYLAKAHEEKLRAIAAAEAKKDEQIAELKRQLEESKQAAPAPAATTSDDSSSISGTTTTATPPVNEADWDNFSKEDLIGMVKNYQSYMAKYIVNAQEQKARDIKAAEEAVAKKFQAKLEAAAGAAPVETPAAPAAEPTVESPPAIEEPEPSAEPAAVPAEPEPEPDEVVASEGRPTLRVHQVTPDSARETPPELQFQTKPLMAKAIHPNAITEVEHGHVNKPVVSPQTTTPVVTSPAQMEPMAVASEEEEEIVAAPEEPVATQEEASEPASTVTVTGFVAPPSDLYVQRNQRVARAAQAGKSRWNPEENDRAAAFGMASQEPLLVNGNMEIPPEVVEADHGLRNDGGVGGLTLAERVAMGANAGWNDSDDLASDTSSAGMEVMETDTPAVSIETEANTVLFDQRNARVAASAQYGKSRWGEAEVERAKAMVAASPDAAVAEADHGLRSDGGVGGPTLSERVNLGAQLLGQQ